MVEICDGAAPTLRGCAVRGGLICGVLVDGPAARPLIRGSVVAGCGRAAVAAAAEGGNGTPREETAGVVVRGGAAPRLEGNTIERNFGHGVLFDPSERGAAVGGSLVDNVIRENGAMGVCIGH